MSNQNYYSLLGVSKNATKREIKKAFREKAKKYHPDINKDPGAEKEFKKYAAAYEVLGDDQKRSQYDRFGHERYNSSHTGEANFDFSNFGFGDIFGDIFGGFSRSRRQDSPTKGEDVHLMMNIKFESAVFGDSIDIKINTDQDCSHCLGIGAKKNSDIQICKTCNGEGSVISNLKTPFGQIRSLKPCYDCGGQGQNNINPCHFCKGLGIMQVENELALKIPVGIREGQVLKINGKGKKIKGLPNGDLYIEINIINHKLFKRVDDDIYSEVQCSFIDSALGNKIEIETIYGNVDLKIPKGTQYGTKLRLKNYGIRYPNGQKGDHFVILNLQTPTKINKKQEKNLGDFIKNKKKSIFF